jgi:hypothetical protein
MRTRLSMLLFVLTTITLNGQNLKIGLVGQPCLTYFTVSGGNAALVSDFKSADKPLFSYQVGILVSKELSERVDLVLGLNYAQRGFQSQYNTANIYAFSFSAGNSIKIVDRYIELPIAAKIYLKKSKVSYFVSVGLKPAFYLGSFSRLNEGERNRYFYSAHRKVHVFAMLGLGLDVNISERWSCTLWPVLEHALWKEVFAQPLSLYPYSLGLNVSLFYSLGN